MRRELDRGRLVSTIAFALRHDPAHFELQLDDEGWTSFEELIIAIRFERHEWACLDESIVKAAIADMDRFEIRDDRIRAVYGHSIQLAKPPAIESPPAILFHGTSADNVSSILQQGILRMRRQFTHLSSDYDWVVRFLDDKPAWTIFAIDTLAALETSVLFRRANHHVWLTDAMPAGLLRIESTGKGGRNPNVPAPWLHSSDNGPPFAKHSALQEADRAGSRAFAQDRATGPG